MVGVKCLDEVVVDTSGCRGVAVIWGCCIVALRCWGGDVCDVFGAIFIVHCIVVGVKCFEELRLLH